MKSIKQISCTTKSFEVKNQKKKKIVTLQERTATVSQVYAKTIHTMERL